MINEFKNIQEFFAELDKYVSEITVLYVFGGAALLRRGLKSATKDIDLVVESNHEFIELQNALEKTGFSKKLPCKNYGHMNLSQIFQREDFRIDLFEKEICGRFSLSAEMQKRAEKTISLDRIAVYLLSNEDIFLLKTMTERDGDINDCIKLARETRLKWNIVLDELKNQIKNSRQDVWVTWVGERLDILQQRGLEIPIMKEVDKLRLEFFRHLQSKQQSNI